MIAPQICYFSDEYQQPLEYLVWSPQMNMAVKIITYIGLLLDMARDWF